jgi:prepilin-type N-terminal cleavage/methylation domain-containing protein
MRRPQRAFTIIELLVVVSIIGLLVTIATTNYTTAQRRARDNARKAHVSSLATAVESYYSVKRSFPGKIHTTIDGQAASPDTFRNCETVISNNYFYYYYPLSDTGAGSLKSCHLRADVPNGSYSYNPQLYSPFPNWIPGLAEYINPAIEDRRFQDKNGNRIPTDGNGFTDPISAIDGGANQTRTYVYRRLKGGFMVYSRLESPIYDKDTINTDNGNITITDEPLPQSGSLVVSGKYIYMIRK